MVRVVAHGLRHRGGVQEGDSVLVACSGGADSVALLRAVHLLRGRRKWHLTLTVAHVQHHLRPPEVAEGDAAFVAALADQLGLAYVRRDINPGSMRGNVEANARDQRYAALAVMAEEVGARFVATGLDLLILARALRDLADKWVPDCNA